MLSELASRIKDLSPIWEDFIKFYQKDIMPKTWDTKGKMMGEQWPELTPAYEKWKSKRGGRRLMELTGKLFKAAQGGSGWVQRVTKKNLNIGVTGEEYYKHVQERAKNPRHYFTTKRDDIPNRAYAYLIKKMDNYLEEVDE